MGAARALRLVLPMEKQSPPASADGLHPCCPWTPPRARRANADNVKRSTRAVHGTTEPGACPGPVNLRCHQDAHGPVPSGWDPRHEREFPASLEVASCPMLGARVPWPLIPPLGP